jgi:hypothetical protein
MHQVNVCKRSQTNFTERLLNVTKRPLNVYKTFIKGDTTFNNFGLFHSLVTPVYNGLFLSDDLL